MILRRVIEHVRTQNWTAIGIDFVIVVFGVFMGIQLGNWNDARANAAKEEVALAAILDDIEADFAGLNGALDAAVLATQASNHLLEVAGLQPLTELKTPVFASLLNTDELPFPEGVSSREAKPEQLWSAIALRFYPSQYDAAFSGLVAAGDLSLISDQELVHDLKGYTALWDALENSQDTTFRPFRDRLIFVGQDHGLSPFKDVEDEELAKLIKANPELEAAVRTVLEYGVLHWQSMKRLRADAEALEAKLRAALEEKE
ncbi:MAG: hypothetical protein AAF668_05800 [Pseudomonadota bacterium]